jgi:spermidine synthase
VNFFIKTLFQGNSPYNGEVKVVESFGVRKLFASGYVQSRSLNKDGLTGSYWDGFVSGSFSLSKDGRILMLGIAGGTGIKLLINKYGLVNIDAVEIDPLMIELSKKYFDLNDKNVNIFNTDALKFVKEARYKYDMICLDLFSKGDVAVGTESESFFQNLRNLMKENAVLVINKLYLTKEEIDKYLVFLHKVFSKTEILTFRETVRIDNIIIYAYK